MGGLTLNTQTQNPTKTLPEAQRTQQETRHRLHTPCSRVVWRVAWGKGERGEEAWGSTGSTHWAGWRGSCPPPLGTSGCAAACRGGLQQFWGTAFPPFPHHIWMVWWSKSNIFLTFIAIPASCTCSALSLTTYLCINTEILHQPRPNNGQQLSELTIIRIV